MKTNLKPNHDNPSFKEYLPSYYVSTVNPHPSYPTLEGRLKTETCVIGGGLTGLCTALPLAENGHEVIVLEAARIGFGASGRSGGQVISDFACSMEEIEKQVGLEQAQWFWQQSLQAVELVDSRIQKHNIQCDLATRLRYRRRPSSALGRIATMA